LRENNRSIADRLLSVVPPEVPLNDWTGPDGTKPDVNAQ
jgi:hypothetical protein